jgi:ABC-type antimicrobial peptide transport system permease subunit
VALVGSACGLVLAAAGGRLLSGILFGVSSLDAAAFAGVLVLVLLVSGCAAFVPAWRASRTDPMEVLREQ